MNTKADKTKLRILSQTNLDRLEIEVNNIVTLYRLGRIRGQQAHQMLHDARKDVEQIFWSASGIVAQGHGKIDFLHKVKNAMGPDIEKGQFMSKPTLKALDDLVRSSKLYRRGVISYAGLRKTSRLARKLVRVDSIVLRQDIRDLTRKAREYDPIDQEPDQEFPELEVVDLRDMLIKLVEKE